MQGWTLSPDEVVALPLDELALCLLVEVAEDRARPSPRNWMRLLESGSTYGRASSALSALAEAWAWLLARGLIAPDLSQTSGDWVFITRLGRKVIEQGLPLVRAVEQLSVDLHPLLEQKVRRLFLTGDFEVAAFAAMKEVEVAVRSRTDADASRVGVPLMRDAFKEGGPLRDPSRDGGEQQAMMDLFAGAIGLFKYPAGHRAVEYDDPTSAAEVILLADLLLRLLG